MPDMIVASTTATQEEVDHAVSADWRTPLPAKEVVKPEPTTAEGEEEVPVTTEEAQEVETAPDSEPDRTQEPRKGGFQKKIDKLTREKSEAQTRADTLASELESYKERLAAIEARLAGKPAETSEEKTVKASAAAPPKPLESEIGSKYKDWNEYNEALIDWKADRRLETRLAERDQTAQERETREIQESRDAEYSEAAKVFAATAPDFNEAINAASKAGMKLPEPIIDLIKELPNGPAVTYYLVKNPDEALALIGLTPAMGFAAIGRISQGLEAEEKLVPVKVPPKKPISTAPTAVKPVAGHSARSSNSLQELSKSSTDDYIRARQAQIKERQERQY